MEQEIWRRLDWATRQVSLEAGRYEVILPPSGVGDMMAELAFGGLGGRTPRTGAPSSPGGRRHAGGRADRLAALHPLQRPLRAGVECTPFVASEASSSDVSVFDNGLPIGRVDWLHEGVLAHLRYHRAGAAKSGVEVAPYVDNLVLRCGGPAAARSTTWWRAPSVDCC